MHNLKEKLKFILKQVDPSLQISKDGLDYLNKLINDTFTFIVNKYGNIPIEDIINELFSLSNTYDIENNLKNHALREYKKTLERYEIGEPRILVFENISFFQDKKSSLLIGTILEYLAAEILELSTTVTRDHKKTRITSDYIKEAINKDEELKELFDKIKLPKRKTPTKKSAKRKTPTKKSASRKSSKKSARRKPSKKNTRRKSAKKSARRKSSKKSARRKSSKKSIRRKRVFYEILN
jgi:hypothetical protein